MTKQHPELLIWQRLAEGDEKAAACWYDSLAPKVHAYVRAIILDREAARDILHDTFLECYRRMKTIMNTKNPTAYLFRIARNRAIDWMKRAGLERALFDPANVQSFFQVRESSHFSPAERELQALSQAFAGLPDELRETLALHFYSGLALREIAEVLKITAHQARYRCEKGIEFLREKLHEFQCE
ncbi:RNA polymerase sigma factor [Planctomycetota bacterium]